MGQLAEYLPSIHVFDFTFAFGKSFIMSLKLKFSYRRLREQYTTERVQCTRAILFRRYPFYINKLLLLSIYKSIEQTNWTEQ